MKRLLGLIAALASFWGVLSSQEVTFNEHIAPIIFKHCTPCHRPGKIAPMPFTNYKEISAYASMIQYVTEVRYMPPWKPLHSDLSFKGERGLTKEEIDQIKQWVGTGVPEGANSPLPERPLFSDPPQMENPDAVFSMSESFEQYGVYYDQFRVFELPTHFTEDKAISAIEFVPGNTSIVRSCFISIDTTDTVEELDEWDPQYGYFSFGELGFVPMDSRWYTWHPGKGMTLYPKGTGKVLPAKARLLLHIHYGPTGVPQKDSSSIRLQFTGEPLNRKINNVPLINPYILTNPPFQVSEQEQVRYHAKFTVPFDLELRSIMPHSHLLGRKWEVFVVEADLRTSRSLIKIDDWDFKWKQQYEFEYPVLLKKGTVIHALAAYDNTIENLLNPSDPPRTMNWGKRMFEEMFLVYFEYVPHHTEETQDLKIISTGSLFNGDNLTISFQNKKDKTLSCQLKDFKGEVALDVFKHRTFQKGRHQIDIAVGNLPKGNYYLHLFSEMEEVHKIIVLVDKKLFE